MHWPPPLLRMKRTPSVPPPLSPWRYHRFGGGAKAIGWGHDVKVSAGRRGSADRPPPQPESKAIAAMGQKEVGRRMNPLSDAAAPVFILRFGGGCARLPSAVPRATRRQEVLPELHRDLAHHAPQHFRRGSP